MYTHLMKLSLLNPLLLLGIGMTLSPLSASDETSPAMEETIRQLVSLHHAAEDLVAQNKFREAAAVYTDIILLEPDDEVAYTNLGSVYLVLGDFTRARESYELALSISPDNDAATAGLISIRDPDRPKSAD